MTNLNIIWLEMAIEDLKEIRLYYSEVASPDTSDKILQKIFNSVQFLSSQPYLGRASSINSALRELVVPNSNYIIPYRVKDNDIEVLRVFDGRQKPRENWI